MKKSSPDEKIHDEKMSTAIQGWVYFFILNYVIRKIVIFSSDEKVHFFSMN